MKFNEGKLNSGNNFKKCCKHIFGLVVVVVVVVFIFFVFIYFVQLFINRT